MILLFPNLDTLRLALTSSIVPAEVTLAPAAVTFDDQGKIYLESDASLTRTVTKNLDRIGVKGSKRHASDKPEQLTCWPQVLPVAREAEHAEHFQPGPGPLRMSDADDLPTLVTEMLRLGNDRQGFRWFADAGRCRIEARAASRDRPAVLHPAPRPRQVRGGHEGHRARVPRARPAGVGRDRPRPPARPADPRRRGPTPAHPRAARVDLPRRAPVPGHVRHHPVRAAGRPVGVDGGARRRRRWRCRSGSPPATRPTSPNCGCCARTRSSNSTRSSATPTTG